MIEREWLIAREQANVVGREQEGLVALTYRAFATRLLVEIIELVRRLRQVQPASHDQMRRGCDPVDPPCVPTSVEYTVPSYPQSPGSGSGRDIREQGTDAVAITIKAPPDGK